MNESEKYIINGKEVFKTDFEDFLKNLTEIPGSWFCDEISYTNEEGIMLDGGETGYDAEDQEGNVYEYRCLTSPNENTCSITKIMEDQII